MRRTTGPTYRWRGRPTSFIGPGSATRMATSATRYRSSEAGRRPASPGRPKCSSSAASICSITLQATVERIRSASALRWRATRWDRSSTAIPEPIVCQTALGGSIDASPFRDTDGKLFLYFKNDGNRVHARTSLWGQPLAADGLSVTGQPVELLKDDQGWEARVVEAPTMVRSPSGYELFFSGGFFGWNPEEGGLSPYAMGYASCSGPLGPCTPAQREPHPAQLQRPRGGLPQRAGPPEHLRGRAAHISSASTPGRRRSGCRKQSTTAATSMSRRFLEGREAADRAEPALVGVNRLVRRRTAAMNSAWVGICSAVWR